MTLRKFQDAYRDAMKELPQYHMSAEQITEKEQKIPVPGHRQMMRRVAAAAVLCLLFGAGSVTAMNYRRSVIEVKENGYSVVSEGIAADAAKEDAGYGAETRAAKEAMADVAEASADEILPEDNIEIMEIEDIEIREYASIEEFLSAEEVTIAIPELASLGENFDTQLVQVTGEGESVRIMLMGESQTFILSQQDTRQYEAYASSTVYTGESTAKREFTNDQGLSYVVFDTVDSGEVICTHAVISVNGRDLSMDFYGYDEQVVEQILAKTDLSIYFRD